MPRAGVGHSTEQTTETLSIRVPLVLWSFTQTAAPLAGRLFIDPLSNGRGLHRDLGQGRCSKMAKVGRLAKPLVNFTAMSHSCRRRYTFVSAIL